MTGGKGAPRIVLLGEEHRFTWVFCCSDRTSRPGETWKERVRFRAYSLPIQEDRAGAQGS